MKIITADSAGFCFGVERAIRLCRQTAERENGCYTLGPLIHNRRVTDELRERGVREARDVSEIPQGAVVVIRSHGAGKADFDALRAKNAVIIDATCPYVSKIHGVVEDAERDGRLPIIIGERSHAEITAIAGWCAERRIFESAAEVAEWLNREPDMTEKPLAVVFQTTSPREIFNSVSETIKKECTNVKIFDTICDATDHRQSETRKLARECDAFIVIGDKASANSRRLAELAGEQCPRVFFIEDAQQLELRWFEPGDTIGITAGASTPARIIKEVTQKMFEETEVKTGENSFGATDGEGALPTASEAPATPEASAMPEVSVSETAITEETLPEKTVAEEAAPASDEAEDSAPATFEEMLEKSIKTLHTGDTVTGIIAAVTPTEVTVDLGIKQSGYIPISELTDDPTVNFEEAVKIGESVEAVVARVSDLDGTVQLSRKRLVTVRTWHEFEIAMNEKAVLEGVVSDTNNGGVLVSVRGFKVFVPAARTGLPVGAEMTDLLKKKVRLIIMEVNRSRGRVVGSIKAAVWADRRRNADNLWNEIEAGKRYAGIVRSVTSFGAFVDIGGADGLLHVSELSWTRITKPSDVVAVGDELEVYVKSVDKEAKKISLGYKDRSEDPWLKFIESYQTGDNVMVKIRKLMSFGAFAEIAPGVDGLIHISQITDHRIDSAGDALKVGDEKEVKIIGIDTERKRVSLSIRAMIEAGELSLQAEDAEFDDYAEPEPETAEPDATVEPEAAAEPEPEAAAEPESEAITEPEAESAPESGEEA
ncbi:MAG: bifunctional 4-hydroxy-3-methylbut-2-enyl diphosphate reductase/30S ribosomal protein S1 [Oscillospiraceae bacterium]|nr:bifunctional 4-hydroxy-3-methylbut-2-enyl diphosphate reductase/30S ribosomal protein S1 [Oscillospiraceae bacterium]